MKQIIALFLTLILVISASACNGQNGSSDSQSESVTQNTDPTESESCQDTPPENTPPAEPNPDQILSNGKYYSMERVSPTTVRYSVSNEQGEEVLSETTDKPIEIAMLGEYIVDIAIGKGSEQLPVHCYYDVREPAFSSAKEYSYVIASTEALVAYLDGEFSARKVVVKSIFDDSFCKEFSAELAETPMPVSSASLSRDKIYLAYDEKGADGTGRIHFSLVDTDRDYFADYDELLGLVHELSTASPYYGGEIDYADLLGVTDAQQIEWVNSLTVSLLGFYSSDSVGDGIFEEYRQTVGYAAKDLNGDGVFELVLFRNDYEVIAIFTTVDGKPFLLDHYWNRKQCSIDHNGQIFVYGYSSADTNSYAIYEIAEDGTSLELVFEFGMDGYQMVGNIALQKYYKVVNGVKASITQKKFEEYMAQYPYGGTATTQTLSGMTFQPLLDNLSVVQVAAKQAYLGVLENRVKVYHTETEEYCYLLDCKTPYEQKPLSTLTNLSYSLVDLDGDMVNELVIDCSDMLILRYYEGTVYLYPFTFRNMDQLNTDGSYSWNHTGQDFEYGERQLYFEGAVLRTQELWRIVNDGESNFEFYIGSNQVTEAEFHEYREKNPKTEVAFSPLKLAWERKITAQEALEIASTYWNVEDGFTEGALGTMIVHRIVLAEDPNDDVRYYRVVWRWEYRHVENNYATVREIYISGELLVDSMTGEYKPIVATDGKGDVPSDSGKG